MNVATSPQRHFASDNYAGICPEAWAALAEANRGHAPGYGDDAWTQKATDLIRDIFETHCEVFFVFNGTAANSLSLASMCQSYHSILCHETAHVEADECGAPEFFSNGTKVLLMPGANGKIDSGRDRAHGAASAPTSIIPSRAPSASRNPPSWARSTRPTRSRPSGRRPNRSG